MKNRKKPLKTTLNGGTVEDLPTVESTAEHKPIMESPLLSEPIDIMEHATGNINVGTSNSPTNPVSQSQSQSQSQSTGFKASPGLFSSSSQPQQQAQEHVKVPEAQTPPPPINLPPDAPEQSFVPATVGGAGPDPNSIPIPDNVARQAASDLADTIMDMYKRIVPELSNEYTKIKEKDLKEIKSLEREGELIVGIHSELVDNNKENKQKLEERAKADAAMIKKPLKKLLEAKQIEAPPHIELIIVLIFVAFTYFMLAKDIKKSNDNLMQRIFDKIAASKRPQESDIPLTEAEEVK